MRNVEHRTGRRFPLTGDFPAPAVVAKTVDQIRLPVGRPVAQIGRIECRFLVGVVAVLLAQLVERLGGGKGRHCLGQELPVHLVDQMRPNLVDSVAAHGQRSLHYQACLAEYLRARMPVKQRARDIAGNGKAGQEDSEQHQVELQSQTHRDTSQSGPSRPQREDGCVAAASTGFPSPASPPSRRRRREYPDLAAASQSPCLATS
jgi:hypothetical protein